MSKFIVMSRSASLFVNRFYVADGPGWLLKYRVACCDSASRPSTHCSETTRSCSRQSTVLFQESVENKTLISTNRIIFSRLKTFQTCGKFTLGLLRENKSL